MKILKQIFLMTAIVIGFSLAAAAQDKGQKLPPKNPPVINPGDKKPPKENPPKNEDKNKDNRGKKPQVFFNENINTIEIESV